MIEKYISGLQHIGIPVRDLGEMLRFLKSLGFREIRREIQPGGEPVAFLECQNLMLEVYQDLKAVRQAGRIDHIALGVKDIAGLFKMIVKEGYCIREGICELPFWEKGIQYFVIEGPEGLKLEFCEKRE